MVGEVRWRSDPMTLGILGELDRFKLPALAQAGIDVRKPNIVLVSRAGLSPALVEAAERDPHLHVVDVPRLVAG